jgi:hypothetical protein
MSRCAAKSLKDTLLATRCVAHRPNTNHNQKGDSVCG